MSSNPIHKKPDQPTESKYDIELPQSIVESYARFLVPEIRKFYESEQGKQILAELQEADKMTSKWKTHDKTAVWSIMTWLPFSLVTLEPHRHGEATAKTLDG